MSHGQRNDNFWTPEVTARAIQMWEAGVTTAVMAERLGCTGATICGKFHRLEQRGLVKARGNPVRRKASKQPAPNLRPTAAEKAQPAPDGRLPLPPSAPGSLAGLWPGLPPSAGFGQRGCKREIRTDAGVRVCGMPVLGQRPYCEACRAAVQRRAA